MYKVLPIESKQLKDEDPTEQDFPKKIKGNR